MCHHGQETRLEGLQQIKPWLANLHVYYWQQGTRLPLHQGISLWQEYLRQLTDLRTIHYGLLEFVVNDQPEQLFTRCETVYSAISCY